MHSVATKIPLREHSSFQQKSSASPIAWAAGTPVQCVAYLGCLKLGILPHTNETAFFITVMQCAQQTKNATESHYSAAMHTHCESASKRGPHLLFLKYEFTMMTPWKTIIWLEGGREATWLTAKLEMSWGADSKTHCLQRYHSQRASVCDLMGMSDRTWDQLDKRGY